ncbi:MAG TPA: phosphate acyltransferase PlsX [candidate division Zixibacteria bacterium]|nr:phosphate acyltransferase PlsX [candidate division Zixibacteria bacterium]HBZ01853.1 phosphate acyltransferase PlsX [candidate division Zixibacteria bacterium]
MRTRIAIDAMGGDFAPFSIVAGAVLAQKAYGDSVELSLVGDKTQIEAELKNLNATDLPIKIVHSTQIIAMGDEPAESVRKKPDSSITVALGLQKSGQSQAFISAGNTGACMAASLIILGRLPAVNRPAIGAFFPTERGAALVLDVGANSDCKAINLYQFGLMGAIYFTQMFSNQNPRVGLLSIGEEKSKGNELTIASHKLLSAADLNFAGNIEGRDILKGKADVVICDGFVGNIILKFAESIDSFLGEIVRRQVRVNLLAKIGALLLQPAFKDLKKNLDSAEYGGAPLLGINGVSIICHGGSSPKAIKNAVRMAQNMVERDINRLIEERLAANGSYTPSEVKQK